MVFDVVLFVGGVSTGLLLLLPWPYILNHLDELVEIPETFGIQFFQSGD